jgi:hypothetical protein
MTSEDNERAMNNDKAEAFSEQLVCCQKMKG